MRMTSRLVVLGLLVATVGCGSGRTVTGGSTPGGTTSGTTGGTTGGTGGSTTVDFATQIQPIFNDNCAFSGCHAADTASGGMVLESGSAYNNLVNVTSTEVPPDKRVLPGNSSASYIIEKLTRNPPRSGERMPLGVAGGLPANEIALIRT